MCWRLRRLADRVVLVFDGDEAGQKAADRALELFLGHEVDVRVLTLARDLDPCDFLLKEGADAFRALVDRAVDPLAFALDRAAARFDLDSLEESRQAAEWVLAILGRVPPAQPGGLDVKVAKALDTLAQRLRVPVDDPRPPAPHCGDGRPRGRAAGRTARRPRATSRATRDPGRRRARDRAGDADPAGRPRPDRPRAGPDRA